MNVSIQITNPLVFAFIEKPLLRLVEKVNADAGVNHYFTVFASMSDNTKKQYTVQNLSVNAATRTVTLVGVPTEGNPPSGVTLNIKDEEVINFVMRASIYFQQYPAASSQQYALGSFSYNRQVEQLTHFATWKNRNPSSPYKYLFGWDSRDTAGPNADGTIDPTNRAHVNAEPFTAPKSTLPDDVEMMTYFEGTLNEALLNYNDNPLYGSLEVVTISFVQSGTKTLRWSVRSLCKNTEWYKLQHQRLVDGLTNSPLVITSATLTNNVRELDALFDATDRISSQTLTVTYSGGASATFTLPVGSVLATII